MRGILLRWLFLTIAILAAAYLLGGIEVSGFFSALLAAALLGFLNAVFRPILLILTLPINVLTLGLFTFVINALLLMMASGVIGGFYVHGFWSALLGSLIISVVSSLLSSFISDRGRIEYIVLEKRGDRWE
ncbi:MAG TPA: phage holin family protein [Desulfuromonadales bacterium]|nr:phage holin family protein [Desulfuromonadales bacterium]